MPKPGAARTLALTLALLSPLGGATPARADSAPPGGAVETAKLRDIRRLLDLTGAGKLGLQVMGQMIPQFKQMLPNVPSRFWDDFMKEANADELVEKVAHIYDRHLSHDEVKSVIAFYETPAGRKLIAVQPKITQESMEVGRKWGMELGQKVQQRLRDKGYQK